MFVVFFGGRVKITTFEWPIVTKKTTYDTILFMPKEKWNQKEWFILHYGISDIEKH